MFYDYVTKDQQRHLAEKTSLKLKKTLGRPLEPILLSGTKLATSWWGIMWGKNLERYATYSNRIGRGKSYVRNGFVIDFQINYGEITSYVQGTRKAPYKVTIYIDSIKESIIEKIKIQCEGKIDSMNQLLEGSFSKGLADLFMMEGVGLFPEPNEIHLNCSCPDWTDCCKHVSAVLYAIGSKLDVNPSLFFTLRGIDIDDFLKDVIVSKTKNILEKGSNCKSKRVIKGANIRDIFHINIDEK